DRAYHDRAHDHGAYDDCAHDHRAHDDRAGHDEPDHDAPDDGADDDHAGHDDPDHDAAHDDPRADDHRFRHHVRALYYGTYDREHPRNVNAIAAMRDAGVDVIERQATVRGTGVRGALGVFAAESRLLVPRRRDFDVVIVGYPGHFDVPRARRLAGDKPLIFDAVLSLEDELITVRRRVRPRSTAATVLRAVDLRALRLPDLVVCGTDAEARFLQTLGARRVAAVFLGANEELYRHPWSPTYPFTAVHFASPHATDPSI